MHNREKDATAFAGILVAILMLLGTIFIITLLTGCGAPKTAEKKKLQIVTTLYPISDWVSNIVGDKADVSCLIENTDMHNYKPSAEDIIKIQNADIFIYNGGESDKWVADVLSKAPNVSSVSLMEILNDELLEEDHVELKNGVLALEEGHKDEMNEHVWLSLRNASKCIDRITDILKNKDSAHKDAFEANSVAYKKQLSELDDTIKDFFNVYLKNNNKEKFLIMADRNPFKYLLNDYGVEYVSAFNGCSAESEASFNMIIFLAKQAEDHDVNALYFLSGGNSSIARAVKENIPDSEKKNIELLALNSLETKTEKGYIETMKDNFYYIIAGLK